jgi:hypothetical protein
MLSKIMSTRPAITSTIARAPPRQGTCSIGAPITCANMAPERCRAVPAPAEA